MTGNRSGLARGSQRQGRAALFAPPPGALKEAVHLLALSTRPGPAFLLYAVSMPTAPLAALYYCRDAAAQTPEDV